MRIKGDIIRSVRKQKKMSQVTLAAGICTQGTVSNIENKNVCDSLEILDAICKRLNLSLESVLDDNDEKKLTSLLNHVEELCNTFKHKEAYSLLQENSIDVTNFQNKELKVRWFYFMGITNLLGYNNTTDSLYYFYRADELGDSNSVYAILSVNSLGIVYEMVNELDKAQVYYEKSINMLKKMTVKMPIEATKIFFNTAKFYSLIEDYNTAFDLACEGMILNRTYQSLYMLDLLAYEAAFNDFMRSSDLTAPDFNSAKAFATFNDNQSLLSVIANDEKNLNR
ncbi:Cro/Cl family transcriptional regulator [Enterococcus ureilyticus]|uniref:Cro/Cl family transcriptional regulator n=1 Tax=Enterococcus ureilyticus TaxID=1131292 RepID=A0A1E5HF24_9ENTE|nr:helix-turn-helix transcriptional regulator [Enterococcus ureilyticus]MBM7689277.1 transcriptional regulator with XRE-family HTH domain [Enterococcus ureilyticus]MBO0446406.1 helix-turn-helix transcriptional regulator [Enterococcus ureilyticus]OEG23552.1 Cro/Cl family transcriptional regulator [Enterococcus ureilyticus]